MTGTTAGTKVQVSGNYAYVIRNASGASNFTVVDITNPATPVQRGTLSLLSIPANIFVNGNYAYVVSSDNSQELQIINISNPASPSLVGTYTDDAKGVYVVGSYAYLALAGSNDLVIVNVSNPASPTYVGGIVLAGNAYEVAMQGSYAYVSTNSTTSELQVVNVSTPSKPSLAGTLNLPTTTAAITLAITGSTVLMAQGSTFYTVNISNPASPSLLGAVGTANTINDIGLDLANNNTYAFIATSDTAAEFKVINITALSSPVVLSFVNVAGSTVLNGMAYSLTLDLAFGVGNSINEEFIVFAPQ
jgi:hypothetical protein